MFNENNVTTLFRKNEQCVQSMIKQDNMHKIRVLNPGLSPTEDFSLLWPDH